MWNLITTLTIEAKETLHFTACVPSMRLEDPGHLGTPTQPSTKTGGEEGGMYRYF